MSTTISRDWSYKPASTNFTANYGAPPCITTEMGDIRTYNRQLEDLRSQSCQSPEKSLKSLVYWSGKASFIDWFWPIESIQITYTLYDFLRFNVPLMAIVHDVSKLGKTPFIKLFIKVHEFFFLNEILTIPASFKHIFSGVPGKKHILHGHSAQQVCPCDRVKPMGRENGGAQRVMTLWMSGKSRGDS